MSWPFGLDNFTRLLRSPADTARGGGIATGLSLDAADQRFGSARFASESEIEDAGYFTFDQNAVFIGYFLSDRGRKRRHHSYMRPLWYRAPAGLLMVGGARSGKLRDILSYSICPGVLGAHNVLSLDPKGEQAMIARMIGMDGKHAFYINPSKLFDLPCHRINPLGHLRRGSLTLHADLKVLLNNIIPASGAAQSKYFEDRARDWMEGICLTIIALDGVLTFPRLYWAINLIPSGGDEYLNFAFEMNECSPLAARVEAALLRKSALSRIFPYVC